MCFHKFENIENIETFFEQSSCFNNPFYYQPDSLSILAQKQVVEYLQKIPNDKFQKEISLGKMFGVLIVKNQDGEIGFLSAFSGQIPSYNFDNYFVPNILDYLQKDGYFKQKDDEISSINSKISEIENSQEYALLNAEIETLKQNAEQQISQYKAFMQEEKRKRDFIKQSSENFDKQQLIKESQFQKAELRRLKQKFALELEKLTQKKQQIETLKKIRKEKSDELQKWLFTNFLFLNAKKQTKNLLDLFHCLPPSGAGECCAPKLLQYAFKHNLTPLKIGEFWFGQSPKGEIRKHLYFYPACNSKCKPILSFMLEGLKTAENPLENLQKKNIEIIYDDDFLCVVNKPFGMLSCPDKKNQESVLSVLKQKFPQNDFLMICHRLDLLTSGLIIAAKNKEVFVEIQREFSLRQVKKVYVAILDGEIKEKSGRISLPLITDITDRPRQKVDFENGKQAITDYEVIKIENQQTFIKFFPKTGRTHQLRVHSAHHLGLNCPIKGDELYGKKSDRMYLHAEKIEFFHPIYKKIMTFESQSNFLQ